MGCAHSCSLDSIDSNAVENYESDAKKMKFDFGFINRMLKRGSRESLENNKAWLLAESDAMKTTGDGGELHSMHSSFRFSFGSPIELEPMRLDPSAATVLLLNLEEGGTDPRSLDLRARRMEFLERNISPVPGSLVRFSYEEICSATRDFCKSQ